MRHHRNGAFILAAATPTIIPSIGGPSPPTRSMTTDNAIRTSHRAVLHKDGRPHEEDQRDENGKDSGNEEIRTMVMAGSPARTRNNSDWGQDRIITPRSYVALKHFTDTMFDPCSPARAPNVETVTLVALHSYASLLWRSEECHA